MPLHHETQGSITDVHTCQRATSTPANHTTHSTMAARLKTLRLTSLPATCAAAATALTAHQAMAEEGLRPSTHTTRRLHVRRQNPSRKHTIRSSLRDAGMHVAACRLSCVHSWRQSKFNSGASNNRPPHTVSGCAAASDGDATVIVCRRAGVLAHPFLTHTLLHPTTAAMHPSAPVAQAWRAQGPASQA